jgi:3-isopropylmalate/(R)-2-methylmalate dehydratase small subunit
MEPFKKLTSQFVSIPVNDIDTDQIIPARFLKVTDKNGLGDNLFYDWRYGNDGKPKPDFILNQESAKDAQILVAGDNFGCGSSREHAPWALMGYGFRAIISSSFADIFRNNALKNGLLPVSIDNNNLNTLHETVKANPNSTLTIDLEKQTLFMPNGKELSFPIDHFSKKCLLQGIDQLGYIMKRMNKIKDYESTHPTRVNTLQG